MSRIRPGTTLSLFAVIVAVSFSFSVINTAMRRSVSRSAGPRPAPVHTAIRLGPNGKIFEDAFGGEYTSRSIPIPRRLPP